MRRNILSRSPAATVKSRVAQTRHPSRQRHHSTDIIAGVAVTVFWLAVVAAILVIVVQVMR